MSKKKEKEKKRKLLSHWKCNYGAVYLFPRIRIHFKNADIHKNSFFSLCSRILRTVECNRALKRL